MKIKSKEMNSIIMKYNSEIFFLLKIKNNLKYL